MRRIWVFAISLVLLALGNSAWSDSAGNTVIQPEAGQVLSALHEYMSGVKSLSATANTTEEVVYGNSHKIQFDGALTIAIRLPSQLSAQVHSDEENRQIYLDEQTFTLFDEDLNVFAQTSVKGSLNDVLSQLYAEYGLTLPGSELFSGNAYDLLVGGATKIVYVGVGKVNGVFCDHIAGSLATMDWQLWVQTDGDPKVCKYLVTDRSVPLAPQYGMTFTKWQVDAGFSEDQFEFKAPADAEAIEFIK